jgi:multidrug efflux system outer membrane protein
MSINMKHVSLAAFLVLAACTSPVGPQSSGIDAPAKWSRLEDAPAMPLAMNATTAIDQTWWAHFEDATLEALIAEALANNKTLQIAKARVEEARAGRGVAQSSLFPQINGAATAQHGNQGLATLDKVVSVGQVDIEASWELDLFGRNQARVAQAQAITESAEASQQAVRVGLLAEVARNYFDLRNYERQIALTKANLDTQNETLKLIKDQFSGAEASDFDVQRAAAQVSSTEAMIPVLQTQYDASLNRLNVLLGYTPGTKDAILKTAPRMMPLNPHILVVAPAKVLAERPDVRAAERRFAAAIAGRDVAFRDIFPNISLTGLFGLQTATGMSSVPWGIGASVIQPILNFGRIESQIDIADAQQKQAFLSYQQTVLEALENMENALSSYVHETTRDASLTNAVGQNRKSVDLAKQQYKNGYTGLLDVLVAQRNLLEAEAEQSASDAELRKALVNIYTAAGGGWDETAVPPPPPLPVEQPAPAPVSAPAPTKPHVRATPVISK